MSSLRTLPRDVAEVFVEACLVIPVQPVKDGLVSVAFEGWGCSGTDVSRNRDKTLFQSNMQFSKLRRKEVGC